MLLPRTSDSSYCKRNARIFVCQLWDRLLISTTRISTTGTALNTCCSSPAGAFVQTVCPQQAAVLALKLPARCHHLSWPDEKLLGAEPLADMPPLHPGDAHAPHAAADVALSYMHQ